MVANDLCMGTQIVP